MALLSLPVSILATILREDSFLIVNLWKCGSKLLNRKLVDGIEYLDLKDERLDTTSRFPKLISFLPNLRYLSLNRGGYYLMASATDLNGQWMSGNWSKLETLSLSCNGSLESFWAFEGAIDKYGNPLYSLTQYDDTESNFFDMSSVFPRLTTLKIVGFSFIKCNDFSGLPNTLTSLTTSVVHLKDRYQRVCATLPRSLLEWKTTIEVRSSKRSSAPAALVSLEFWESAPPNLHTIDCINDMTDDTRLDVISLPKSLTKCHFTSFDIPRSIDLVRQLPSGFKDIAVDLTTGTGLSLPIDYPSLGLPSQISSLLIRLNPLIFPQFIALIPTLPSTLTSLSIENAELDWSLLPSYDGDESFWPPHLTRLTTSPYTFPFAHAGLLPNTLTAADLTFYGNGTIDGVELPAALTALKLLLLDVSVDEFDIGPCFPSNLRVLTITCPAFGRNLKVDFLNHLPSSLIYLDMRGFRFSRVRNDNMIRFPPKLESLYTRKYQTSWISALPSTLTSFETYEMPNKMSPKALSAALMGLPSGLRTFVAEGSGNGHFPLFDSIDFLTRLTQLETLNIASFCQFHPSLLAHLPQSLRSVRFRLTHFSSEFKAFINPRWQVAHINEVNPSDPSQNELAECLPLACVAQSSLAVASRRLREAAQDQSKYPHPKIKAMFS